MLRCENVTVRYGNRKAVDDLSFSLEEGQWLMLAGPNGAGKTTLIEAIAGGVPYTGRIFVEGKNIRGLKPAELARKIGVLSQKNSVGYAYTVDEVVSLGRYSHRKGFLSGSDAEGEDKVEKALEMTGMKELRRASMLTLSGGETQRAFLAQVFAQDPQILILDEPSNHLDLGYQKLIFSLTGSWLREPGRAVLSVAHDLSLARRFGTQILLMDRGRCVSRGSADETLTRDTLMDVYGMDVYEWMHEMLEQWK